MKKKNIYIIISCILVIVLFVVVLVNQQKKIEEEKQESETYLTEEEKNQVKDFLEDEKNNCFLFCEYQDASDININQLLYRGAGISKELSDNQKKEYNEKIMEEIGTLPQVPLLVAVKEEDVKDLIKEKTGKEINDIESKLKDWIFIEDGELYAKSFSGEGYSKVNCRVGVKEGDNYIVYVKLKDYPDSKLIKVTLKKQGDSYIFVSNEFIE